MPVFVDNVVPVKIYRLNVLEHAPNEIVIANFFEKAELEHEISKLVEQNLLFERSRDLFDNHIFIHSREQVLLVVINELPYIFLKLLPLTVFFEEFLLSFSVVFKIKLRLIFLILEEFLKGF